MKWIYIEVDTNDADYIGKISRISDEDLEIIRPLIEAISKFEPYESVEENHTWYHRNNYPNGEIYRPDLGEKSIKELYPDISEEIFELFSNYTPYNEYGFRTIEEIKIFDEPIEILL